MIEHLDEFFRDPFGVLFSFSGLSFFGGLIVAAFAVGYYGERNKIRWPVMADAAAPALMLAYAVGRIGCQLSGDGCWGIPNAVANTVSNWRSPCSRHLFTKQLSAQYFSLFCGQSENP